MTTLLLYIIKSSGCLILFYLGYKILLANETFFRFNRFVLLVGMAVCMVLPLVEIRTATPGVLQQPMGQLEEFFASKSGEPSNERIKTTPGSYPFNSREGLLWWIYLGGMGLQLGQLTLSLGALALLVRNGQRVRTEEVDVIVVKQSVNPFNWGHYIVVSEEDLNGHLPEIVAHEQVHCSKRHTLDLLLAETVILLHWFNPAAWLLKNELQNVHEFEADNGVLHRGIDATRYQLLLVKKAVGSSSYTLTNSFNHSKIKKRITMMIKKRSAYGARLKSVLLVPVAVCAAIAFARTDANHPLEPSNESSTISLPEQMGRENKDAIEVKIITPSNEVTEVRIHRNDNQTSIRKKLKGVVPKDPTVVSIKASGDVPMGQITDIKEVIREICVRDSVYRISYRLASPND